MSKLVISKIKVLIGVSLSDQRNTNLAGVALNYDQERFPKVRNSAVLLRRRTSFGDYFLGMVLVGPVDRGRPGRVRRLFRERDPRRPFKSILTTREPTAKRVKYFLKNEGHIVSFQEK